MAHRAPACSEEGACSKTPQFLTYAINNGLDLCNCDIYATLESIEWARRELLIQCSDEKGMSPQHTIQLPDRDDLLHGQYNQWYDEQSAALVQWCNEQLAALLDCLQHETKN